VSPFSIVWWLGCEPIRFGNRWRSRAQEFSGVAEDALPSKHGTKDRVEGVVGAVAVHSLAPWPSVTPLPPMPGIPGYRTRRYTRRRTRSARLHGYLSIARRIRRSFGHRLVDLGLVSLGCWAHNKAGSLMSNRSAFSVVQGFLVRSSRYSKDTNIPTTQTI